ncbi:hypothetical protein H9L15_01245 [Sphingomonas daechungensis]|uniref:Uncharacterized protein n=1 Tax=Sphingomonas daechungensis TaxID=1176646 RepID=A0ABX6T2K9_9SPHN|nr:hypothetical protein [Sphingomonas daechungensis]QNP43468.1 hypothetical protein H9L15_01245 [Sphingomonas daechungensis]
MSLLITATNVTELGNGMWLFDMPPHQVRHFGRPSSATGPRSVLLLNDCEFDPEQQHLRFKIDEVTALNVGTTSQAVGIDAQLQDEAFLPSKPATHAVSAGPGDRNFLQLVRSELSADLARAAEELLAGVRVKSPGDLKRGQSRNFSETPDNFWYVIVQPRINELSITVRGPVDHFKPMSELVIKDDRGIHGSRCAAKLTFRLR